MDIEEFLERDANATPTMNVLKVIWLGYETKIIVIDDPTLQGRNKEKCEG
jgi:hypothetical protein